MYIKFVKNEIGHKTWCASQLLKWQKYFFTFGSRAGCSSSVRMSVNVSLQPSEFGCLDCSTVFKLVQDNFPSAVLTVSKSVHVACGLIMFLFCLVDPGC